MNKKVIIIGAGGHGKVIADIVKLNNDETIGFLDDKEAALLSGFTVLGKVAAIVQYVNQDCWFIVAIGDNRIRKRIMAAYSNIIDDHWYKAIHPTAVIAADAAIGYGTAVMANAVINSGTKIGIGCIINTAATVDHDNTIADFVHISPGSHLSGTVSVCEGTWIGTSVAVSNNVNIAGGDTDNQIIIGVGAVVIKSIEKSGTYIGVPARRVCQKF